MFLENQWLILRPTEEKDLDFVLEAENKQENQPFILSYTRERHQQVITSPLEEHLIIAEKDTGSKMGFIVLGHDPNNKSLEFRRIVVNEKGKGIGRQCLQLIKQYCFDQLQYQRLWLDVFDFNSKAIHLYKSEGFVEEGKLVESLYRNGSFHNLVILSMFKSEY